MQHWQIDDIVPLIKLDEGFSPLDIWQEIHTTAEIWERGLGDDTDHQEQLNTALRMATRLKNFPAQRWIGFNHAIGWTKEAATLLSWCEGGRLRDILTIWNKLGFTLNANNKSDFSALLLNPSLLPANQLSQIIECGEHKVASVCLLLSARIELPEIDIPLDLQERLPEPVKTILTGKGFEMHR
ncbi:hypothetical protein, partial [Bartonella sp. LJL80]